MNLYDYINIFHKQRMGKKNTENTQSKRITRSQQAGKTRKPTPQIEPYLLIKTKTWQKDSHGLFDYQAGEQQYTNQKLKVFPFRKKIQKNNKNNKQSQKQSRYYICRSKECTTQSIHLNSTSNNIKEKNDMFGVCEVIATKAKRGVHFKIKTALRLENLSSALQRQALKLQNKTDSEIQRDKNLMNFKNIGKDPQIKVFNPLICPFTVTKKFYKDKSNNQGYPLRPGNIIKFGRVQYVVVEMKIQDQCISLRNTTDLKDVSGYQGVYEVNHKKEEKQWQSKSQGYVPTCKVCLCSEQNQEDVLISPCNCKGYCGVIHIQCLRQWINSKVKKQYQGLVASYNFNRFECQICKMPFPQIIKTKNRKIEMMGIQKPDKPYIIIESINPPRSLMQHHPREEQRCLHVISGIEKTSLKIGRGHSCQIRISDISVSRAHAQIELNDNKFLIKDTKSKFGTLVLFDEQFTLNQKHPLLLQSGRCLYEFSIQKQEVGQQIEGATQSQNEEMQNEVNGGNQDGKDEQNQ